MAISQFLPNMCVLDNIVLIIEKHLSAVFDYDFE